MVDKVYIVWCKLNRTTDKFDCGVFADKAKAEQCKSAELAANGPEQKHGKVWVQEYRLS